MGNLFKPACGGSIPNTGIATCNPMIKDIKGLIFCSSLNAYTADVAATLLTALKASVLDTDITQRLLPFFEIAELTADNTVERPKIVKGSGNVSYGAAKPRDLRFEIENIGLPTYQKIVKINGLKKLYAFFYDSDNQLIGAENSAGLLIPIKIQAHNLAEPKLNSDGTVNIYWDIITEDPYALGTNSRMVKFSDTPLKNELSGLYDVTLAATPTALTITVTGTVDVTGEDFIEKYNGELDVAGGWVFTNAAGAAVTPSVVTYVAGSPASMRFTIAPGTYSAKLETPTELVALSVGSAAEGSYESNVLTGIVVPAT